MLKSLPARLLTFWLGLLSGLLLGSQILGHLGLYRPWLAVPFSLAAGLAAGWLLRRTDLGAFYRQVFPAAPTGRLRWLDAALALAGAAITLLLIAVPLARWPLSPISQTLAWDAGAYHFPKAIELLNTGTVWDFSISYGEYPFGYETLLTLAAMPTHSGALFGTAHLLTGLFMLLVVWALIRRYTGLPAGLTLLLTSLLLTFGTLLGLGRTPWWIYRSLLDTIGKNDLFAGAALLAVLFYAPVGPAENRRAWHPTAMALATFIAAAVKPSALLAAAPLWIIAALELWRTAGFKAALRRLLLCGLMILPGVLWLGRNFIAQGVAFSPDVTRLQQWSIWNNLTNPWFYNYIPLDLIIVLVIGGVTTLLAVFVRRIHWTLPVVFAALLLTFAVTAQSGFYGTNQVPTEMAWRFGLALATFAFLLPLVWLAPLLRRAWDGLGRSRWLPGAVAVLVLAVSAAYIAHERVYLTTDPANAIVLRDQFREPVGVDGYHSPYDYVYQNVRNSVVWVENGLPFYAYGPGFTNSVTRTRKADYLVALQTAWFGGDPAYPGMLSDPAWDQNWQLIYADSEGRVYQRR